MNEIYPLTQFQAANLLRGANNGTRVFAILEPSPTDSEERRKQLVREMDEMNDLISLGLLTDISKDFEEPIKVSKLNNNRGFSVVRLTDQAIIMFHECGRREIN